MQDLALTHQVLNGAGDIFDRHGRVDPVLVEQVDAIRAKAPQRALDRLLDVLGSAVEPWPALARNKSMSQPNFDVITTWLRNGWIASPRIRSHSCGP
jgi:hypothetical protein